MSDITTGPTAVREIPPNGAIWEVRGIYKAFPGVQALDDVSMSV